MASKIEEADWGPLTAMEQFSFCYEMLEYGCKYIIFLEFTKLLEKATIFSNNFVTLEMKSLSLGML